MSTLHRALALIALAGLSACGGGSSSSTPPAVVQTSAPAKAPTSKATLSLRFPAHMAKAKISGNARKPAYINPNGISLVITAFGTTVLDPVNSNAPYFLLSEAVTDLTSGISTLTVPLVNGNYAAQNLTITEYDGAGGGDVLAYGWNDTYTDANGNFQNGSFTVTTGGTAAPVVTMVMNVAGIAWTTDPVNGNGSSVLSSSLPGTGACINAGTTIYVFPVDASGSFVVPGQQPGGGLTGGDSNNAFPGIPAVFLNQQDSGTSAHFVPGIAGGFTMLDPSGVQTTHADFEATNPIGTLNPPFGFSNPIDGWINGGPGSGLC